MYTSYMANKEKVQVGLTLERMSEICISIILLPQATICLQPHQ